MPLSCFRANDEVARDSPARIAKALRVNVLRFTSLAMLTVAADSKEGDREAATGKSAQVQANPLSEGLGH